MDFFDDINKAIENAGNTAKQKTRDLTDIVKMNNAIKEEEKNLQDIYRSIGEIFVKKYYSETEKSLRNLVSQARETEQNIELYTTKVQEIKKVDTCPKCGKEIQSGAAFCMHCGTPLTVQKPLAEKPQKKESRCEKCGSPLEEGIMFCINCGTPVENLHKYSTSEEPTYPTATNQQAEAAKHMEEPAKINMQSTENQVVSSEIMTETTRTETMEKKNTTKTLRFCTKCGNQLEEGEKFCIHCGTLAADE